MFTMNRALLALSPVIAITDLDKDGKADVSVAQDKSVHVFLHQS